MDRSSCPQGTSRDLIAQLIQLRRSRHIYRQLAQLLGMAVSTVACRLKQADFHRLAELEPAPVVVRYEYPKAGDLLHLDIKKLGRFWRPGHRVTGDRQQGCDGGGWEFVQVAIDDTAPVCSAWAETHPHQTLYAAYKRQGRALHPDEPARVGLNVSQAAA